MGACTTKLAGVSLCKVTIAESVFNCGEASMSSTASKRSVRLDESLESGRGILRALHVDGYAKFDPVDSLREEMREFSMQAVVAVRSPEMIYFGQTSQHGLVCKKSQE